MNKIKGDYFFLNLQIKDLKKVPRFNHKIVCIKGNVRVEMRKITDSKYIIIANTSIKASRGTKEGGRGKSLSIFKNDL